MRSDDARQSELARDDRRVRRHAAGVGHDRRRASHDRHPIGRRHARDQHLARLHRRLFVGGRSSTRTAPMLAPGLAPSPWTTRLRARAEADCSPSACRLQRRDRAALRQIDLAALDRELEILRHADSASRRGAPIRRASSVPHWSARAPCARGSPREIDRAWSHASRQSHASRNSFSRDLRRRSRRATVLSSTCRSGVTAPCTTASPSPHAASMTMRDESRVAGSEVNMTPDFSEFTIRCTTTATGISAGRPCLMR